MEVIRSVLTYWSIDVYKRQTRNNEAANNRHFNFSVTVTSVPQKYRSKIPVTGISAHLYYVVCIRSLLIPPTGLCDSGNCLQDKIKQVEAMIP